MKEYQSYHNTVLCDFSIVVEILQKNDPLKIHIQLMRIIV